MRFQIAYGRTKPLLIATGMPMSKGYLELTDTMLEARMGWAFRASIPLTAIRNVEKLDKKVISIGVHGWNGRWLVNGAGDRLVRIDIDPAIKARSAMLPINLRELTVSLEDQDAFVAAINAG